MDKTVAEFRLSYRQFLLPDGTLIETLPESCQETDLPHQLYQWMMQTRLFDAKAIALQRTGQLGTYPSTLGQEAISVGIGAAMRPSDVLCGYYRDYGAQLMRGVKMSEIYALWGGDERGHAYQSCPEDFPICIPIASQTLHAVGVATAMQYRQQQRAVVTVLGDGGTSRGDFYEAMNLAGAWQLPVVFVINNNQWAISVPRDKQTAAKTFAQKAIAAGIPSWQCDGNDVFAVKDSVEEALNHAYQGQGPTVIEAISYRLCDHTTADDAKRYREAKELEVEQGKDPIQRLKVYLSQHHQWTDEKEQSLKEQLTHAVNEAVKTYQSMPKKSPESMFDHLYEELPSTLEEQVDELKQQYQGEQHG